MLCFLCCRLLLYDIVAYQSRWEMLPEDILLSCLTPDTVDHAVIATLLSRWLDDNDGITGDLSGTSTECRILHHAVQCFRPCQLDVTTVHIKTLLQQHQHQHQQSQQLLLVWFGLGIDCWQLRLTPNAALVSQALVAAGCQRPRNVSFSAPPTTSTSTQPQGAWGTLSCLVHEEVAGVWREYLKEVASLQQLCRNCVRNSVVSVDSIGQLPLPKRLVEYVALNDVELAHEDFDLLSS